MPPNCHYGEMPQVVETATSRRRRAGQTEPPNAFLHKPFTSDTLSRAVRNALAS